LCMNMGGFLYDIKFVYENTFNFVIHEVWLLYFSSTAVSQTIG
jgi:hypothetical protein